MRFSVTYKYIYINERKCALAWSEYVCVSVCVRMCVNLCECGNMNHCKHVYLSVSFLHKKSDALCECWDPYLCACARVYVYMSVEMCVRLCICAMCISVCMSL